MAELSENEILDIVYSLYETDDAGWDTASSEYLSARAFANAAIRKWENYDNTEWKSLFTTLTAAADGTKTLTANTYSYSCPTNFVRLSSWVRTLDANNSPTFWEVVQPENIAKYAQSQGDFCYITGSRKAGFKLNFNPNKTLTTGHTINYEYYKQATVFAAITDTTEVPDPYFIVYYILSRFLKNDGEDYAEEKDQWTTLLENMRTVNLTGYFDNPDALQESMAIEGGFGA